MIAPLLFISNGCSFFSSNNDKIEEKKDIIIDAEITENRIKVGESAKIVYSVSNATDNSVTFDIENDCISVTQDGVVTALKVGTSKVFIFSNENPKIYFTIDVEIYDDDKDDNSDTKDDNSDSNDKKDDEDDDKEDEVPSSSNGFNTLVFNDEFNGDSLNTSYWSYQEGDGTSYGISGWGNSELEYYSKDNVYLEDGYLNIKAKKESKGNKSYTSGRIRTYNKIHFTYGRIEAKILMPEGKGLWPAFWMLPNDTTYGGWPNSGELDIMEARGRLTQETTCAIHYANTSNTHSYMSDSINLSRKSINPPTITDFHVYALEWTTSGYKFYVDDYCFYSVNIFETYEGSSGEPFDKDFYILFNLAVGGSFDSYIEPDDSFSDAIMQVDYIRWYQ